MYNTKITHQMDTVMDTILSFFCYIYDLQNNHNIHTWTEQTQVKFHQKRDLGPFLTLPTGQAVAGRNRDRRIIHFASHAEINVCLSATWHYERTRCLSLAQQSLTLVLHLIPVAPCKTHTGGCGWAESRAHARAHRQEGGETRQIEEGDGHRHRNRERGVTFPIPVGAEYTVCVRGVCQSADTKKKKR